MKRYKSSRIVLFSLVISLLFHVGIFFYIRDHFTLFYKVSSFEEEERRETTERVKEADILLLEFKLEEEGELSREIYSPRPEKNRIAFSPKKRELPIKGSGSDFSYRVRGSNIRFVEDKGSSVKEDYTVEYFDLIEDLKKNVPEIPEGEEILESNIPFKKERMGEVRSFRRLFDIKRKTKGIFYKVKHEKTLKDSLKRIKRENSKLVIKKRNIFSPIVPSIPSLKELNTISCADDFIYNIEYIPREDREGFIFALILIPKPTEKFKRLGQNFYFLIDRSNYIKNKRLTMTRHAISSAISFLDKSDRFNILAFDSKMTAFLENTQYPTDEILKNGRIFLRKMTLGKFFTSSNFFLPLNYLLKNRSDEIDNIIFITSGEGIDKLKNRHLIKDWTDCNMGRQALYCVSMKDDRANQALDLLCSLNHGKLLTSATYRGIKRQLTKLIRTLDYPIAKNISLNIYDRGDRDIVIYPKRKKRSHLYINKPYVILGSSKNLENFTIFLQGKNPNGWFNIKKEISFKDAINGGKALKKRWAKYRANKCYELYLRLGKLEYLKRAEELLAPYNLIPVFK